MILPNTFNFEIESIRFNIKPNTVAFTVTMFTVYTNYNFKSIHPTYIKNAC